LEARLGSAVLARRDNGVQLTDAGQATLAAAQQMESIAAALERTLASQPEGLSGRVRLTTTEALGSYFWLPRLLDLHALQPGIELELSLDSRNLSLSRRKADLAIRLARPQEEGLVVRHLANLGYALYIRSDHPYLQGGGLHGALPLCRYDESLEQLPESHWLVEQLPAARTVLRVNSALALQQAVRSGWGAALLPSVLADDPALLRLSPGVQLSRELWLAYPPEYREVPRYRLVIDWLVRQCEDAKALLAGQS
jgi:DNA-binding transcriptional LysR family regulator